jgi:hypothetical protein
MAAAVTLLPGALAVDRGGEALVPCGLFAAADEDGIAARAATHETAVP